jgi:RHS repeat-associated protein
MSFAYRVSGTFLMDAGRRRLVQTEALLGCTIVRALRSPGSCPLVCLAYRVIPAESGLFPTDRRFTGQRWEASLGLYDYRARFYDPTLGRFLQPDPIVPEPGTRRGSIGMRMLTTTR